jgi:hypothetical protein
MRAAHGGISKESFGERTNNNRAAHYIKQLFENKKAKSPSRKEIIAPFSMRLGGRAVNLDFCILTF